MNVQQDTITQADRFAQAFSEIKPDITKKDREYAREKTGLSAETISKYTNGKVEDLDTAAGLLMIFRSCISEREKLIEVTA